MKRYRNYGDLVGALEQRITEAVRGNDPRYWDENHISLDVTKGVLSVLDGAKVHGLDRSFRVECDAFKLRGDLETDHGDIAVNIRFHSWDGMVVEGVGFLEAKRRYRDSGDYKMLKKDQITRILERSPYTQLVLYSYDQAGDFEDNIRALSPGRWTHSPLFQRASSYALSVPLGTAAALGRKTSVLHRFGIPLSLQCVGRYLRGFDLDFSSEARKNVIGYAESAFGVPPRYVITVGVGPVEEEESLQPEFRPSQDVYEGVSS